MQKKNLNEENKISKLHIIHVMIAITWKNIIDFFDNIDTELILSLFVVAIMPGIIYIPLLVCTTHTIAACIMAAILMLPFLISSIFKLGIWIFGIISDLKFDAIQKIKKGYDESK